MSNQMQQADQENPELFPLEIGPPYPLPIGTPPGGGSWTWNVNTGLWVEINNNEGVE